MMVESGRQFTFFEQKLLFCASKMPSHGFHKAFTKPSQSLAKLFQMPFKAFTKPFQVFSLASIEPFKAVLKDLLKSFRRNFNFNAKQSYAIHRGTGSLNTRGEHLSPMTAGCFKQELHVRKVYPPHKLRMPAPIPYSLFPMPRSHVPTFLHSAPAHLASLVCARPLASRLRSAHSASLRISRAHAVRSAALATVAAGAGLRLFGCAKAARPIRRPSQPPLTLPPPSPGARPRLHRLAPQRKQKITPSQGRYRR